MQMRALIVVIVIAALGWSGYWWVSADLRRDAVETWFAARAAEGWVAEYDDLTITGFPNRIDTILTGVELADPQSGWSWSGPRFEMLTLSYRPFELILAWPGVHTVATPFERLAVQGEVLRASAAVTADGSFTLSRSRIEGQEVSVESTQGWTAAVAQVAAATDAAEPMDGTTHRLGLSLTEMTLSDDLRGRIDPGDVLPPVFDVVHLDAVATFDAALSLTALEQDLPDVLALDVADASATWGALDLRALGEVTADSQGLAEGEMTIRARNWEEMIQLGVANGAIPEGNAQAVVFGLRLLARTSGDPSSLSAPLQFRDGLTRLGPIILGPSPRLQRR